MNADVFENPKDENVLLKFLEATTLHDDLILDFFAGSGTTGHAVMELNKEDGGNRKFILAQIPEQTKEDSEAYKAGYKKISAITIERNKRVIRNFEKESKDNPDLFKDKSLALGFKVYKLSKSHFPRVDFVFDPAKTEKQNAEDLKKYISEKEGSIFTLLNESDIFDEVLLKNGFMLNYKIEQLKKFKDNKVYSVADCNKKALICLEQEIKDGTIGKLTKDELFICLERSLTTTQKWNLKHLLDEKLIAF